MTLPSGIDRETGLVHPRVTTAAHGYDSPRARGLHKHTPRCRVLCALAHLYRVRRSRRAQARGRACTAAPMSPRRSRAPCRGRLSLS